MPNLAISNSPSQQSEHEHTNLLIHEKSPYLLQHAHNPVNWYPWGETAFEKARKENKPIFLSISYATCHWCHVMEKESFSNPEIAAIMSKYFVSIKVDREERPDIDRMYMIAASSAGWGGGWPLSMWLTPDLKPFYGGTYFPHGIFGFLDHDAPNLIFIAGGIGITPFMSMLRYIHDRKLKRNITLIWGNKTERDIVFRDELEKITMGMPSLKVIHVMSEQDDWPGEKGLIDAEKLRK